MDSVGVHPAESVLPEFCLQNYSIGYKNMIEKNDKQEPVRAWWQAGLQLFLRLSSWIVFPIIIAIFFGKFLDQAFGTEPWLFLISIGSTFVFSIIMIVRIGLKEIEK